MLYRVRDNNQGIIMNGGGQNNPLANGNIQFDEDEMNFIPFDHTQFSKDNVNAMALLIILFERYS